MMIGYSYRNWRSSCYISIISPLYPIQMLYKVCILTISPSYAHEHIPGLLRSLRAQALRDVESSPLLLRWRPLQVECAWWCAMAFMVGEDGSGWWDPVAVHWIGLRTFTGKPHTVMGKTVVSCRFFPSIQWNVDNCILYLIYVTESNGDTMGIQRDYIYIYTTYISTINAQQ